jgi:chemotaxis protein methyltransferase CheR
MAPSVEAPAAFAVPVAMDDSWVETIRRAAERVHELTEQAATLDDSQARESAATAAMHVRTAIELLGRERFAEARAVLGLLPPESTRGPDVLLLSAVLFTHGGDLAKAEEACAELLRLDDMSAGAHYVLALCREHAGDCAGAREHDRIAVYLDPSFAMPRLHLGLLARRSGNLETARQELGQALALLDREEPSRLLIFGGGFTREALSALCRAELAACGEGR